MGIRATWPVQGGHTTEIGDMVAGGMMEIHTAHAVSKLMIKSSKALEKIFTPQGPSFETVG